jgi:hypothetical protein
MKETKTAPKARQHRHREARCCVEAECAGGRRNLYFSGKRLTPDSLRTEQDYLIERRRLINRAMHGWGVVYGYPVTLRASEKRGTEAQRLTVGPGLALDRAGRELVQTDMLALDLPAILFLDDQGHLQPGSAPQYRDPRHPDRANEECWLLMVHYAERLLDPLAFTDRCGCDRREWNLVCETVRYSLRRIDCRACCAPFACELECGCAGGPCCEDLVPRNDKDERQDKRVPSREMQSRDPNGQAREDCEQEPPPRNGSTGPARGGCRCLCEHLTALHMGAECTALCEVDDPCAQVRVDLHNGVPLACLKLKRGECGWEFDSVYDDCGPRRLVKRNDLLFDLIRGCDLTRIVEVSWGAWHRREAPVDFSEFDEFFGQPYSNAGNLTRFRVRFSRPVFARTVTADCFAMRVFFREKEGGWRQALTVPIAATHAQAQGDFIEDVALVVMTRWVNDAVRGGETRFDTYEARVEIEIRGDFILDCNGQALDANAVGLRDVPTGNGTPGGTYLSTFRVGRRMVPDDATS